MTTNSSGADDVCPNCKQPESAECPAGECVQYSKWVDDPKGKSIPRLNADGSWSVDDAPSSCFRAADRYFEIVRDLEQRLVEADNRLADQHRRIVIMGGDLAAAQAEQARLREDRDTVLNNAYYEQKELKWKIAKLHEMSAIQALQFDPGEVTQLTARVAEADSELATTKEQLKDAREEAEGLTLSVIRMGKILSNTINVLKGPPPADTLWSTHDTAQVASAVLADCKHWEAEAQRLQKFKDFVHKTLTDMGVPVDPGGEHTVHGCRIGDRLEIVANWKKEAEYWETEAQKRQFAGLSPCFSPGVVAIAAERSRQLTKWPINHDDEHTNGLLACLAIVKASIACSRSVHSSVQSTVDACGLEGDGIRDGGTLCLLAEAGALMAAEYDRAQRMTRKGPSHG